MSRSLRVIICITSDFFLMMSSIVSFVSWLRTFPARCCARVERKPLIQLSLLRRQGVDAGALQEVGELLAGIEHPRLHGALGDADDRAGLFHRLLVVINQIDDLAVRRR